MLLSHPMADGGTRGCIFRVKKAWNKRSLIPLQVLVYGINIYQVGGCFINRKANVLDLLAGLRERLPPRPCSAG